MKVHMKFVQRRKRKFIRIVSMILVFMLVFSSVSTAMAVDVPLSLGEEAGSESIEQETPQQAGGTLPLTLDDGDTVYSEAATFSIAGRAATDESGRIEIDSYEKFKRIGVDPAYPLNGSYIQTADFKIPDGTAHTPIGDADTPFTGTYDGGSHTITGGANMTWNAVQVTADSYSKAIAVFGAVEGTVKDVTLDRFAINATEIYEVAIFAARLRGAEISGVNVRNSSVSLQSAEDCIVSAFAGGVENSHISNCNIENNEIKLTGSGAQKAKNAAPIGSLGENTVIENTHVSGGSVTVTAAADSWGNAAGFAATILSVTIRNCTTSCDVTIVGGASNLGGFAGWISPNTGGSIENCTVSGKLTADGITSVGGRAGAFLGGIDPNATNLQVKNCLALSKITTVNLTNADTFCGNFVGVDYVPAASLNTGRYENNMFLNPVFTYVAGTNSPGYNNAIITGGISQMDTTGEVSPLPETLHVTSLNMPANIYSMGDVYGYNDVSYAIKDGTDPQGAFALSASSGDTVGLTQSKAVAPNEFPTVVVTYNRVGAAPITREIPVAGAVIAVPDYETFAKIGQDAAYPLSGSYLQTQNFTIPDGTAHTPIGNSNTPFTGIYDGDNHTISGSSLQFAPQGNGAVGYGLFGSVDGLLQDLTVTGIKVSQTISDNTGTVYFGTIAGTLTGNAKAHNVYVKDGSQHMVTAKALRTGGFCGSAWGGASITDCSVDNVSISGHSTGTSTTIVIGGFAGDSATGGRFINCVSNSHVEITRLANTANNSIGGFFGAIQAGSTIKNCEAHGSLSTGTLAIDTGGTLGQWAMLGGFAGWMTLSSNGSEGAIYNNKTDVSVTSNWVNGTATITACGGFIGLNYTTQTVADAVLSGNTYTAACKYPNAIGGNGNNASYTASVAEDKIKLISTPAQDPITIGDVTSSAQETWVNGGQDISVTADMETTNTDVPYVFVSTDPEADSGDDTVVGTLTEQADGTFAGSVFHDMLGDLNGKATLYVCVQMKKLGTGEETARASREFTILRDIWSPRMSDISAQTMQDGSISLSLAATDSQSGVAGIFASESETDYTAGQVALEYNETTKKWSVTLPGGTWYLYAKDAAGNVSAAPEKVETAVSDWIPIYDYVDFSKIGVEKGYPLDGKYIQMADFKIPDGTAHTPIGNADAPFTGTYNGNNKAITGGKNMTWEAAMNMEPVVVGSGIFGNVSGTIYDLNLKDFVLSGEVGSFTAVLASVVSGNASIHGINMENTEINLKEDIADNFVIAGLVSYVQAANATIEDVIVDGITINAINTTGAQQSGGLAGSVNCGVRFENCHVRNASLTGQGGTTLNSNMGGFVSGVNGGEFVNCSSDARITNNGTGYTYTGGFIGISFWADGVANPSYTNCVATGSMSSPMNVASYIDFGGFAGVFCSASGTKIDVTDCSALMQMGAVGTAPYKYVGAFTGRNHSVGSTVSAGNFVGNQALSNGYNRTGMASEDSNVISGIALLSAPAPSVTSLKVQELDKNYNISAAAEAFGYTAKWSIDNPKFELSATAGDSISVQQIKPLDSADEAANITITYQKGTDTQTATIPVLGVIAVPDFATFEKVGKDIDGGYGLDRGYLQTADITIPDGTTWTPIGDYNTPFAGTYDGGGYTVTGGAIRYTGIAVSADNAINNAVYTGPETGAALFGYASGGTLKNVLVTGLEAHIENQASYLAGLVAATNDADVFNVHITNCVLGNIASNTGYTNAGGLVGWADNGSVFVDCTVSGTNLTAVSGAKDNSVRAAGFATLLYSSAVRNCSSDAVITSDYSLATAGGVNDRHFSGGFAARYRGSQIADCRANGTLHVPSNANSALETNSGGFIGEVINSGSGRIVNCNANVSLPTGLTDGTENRVGGFIGYSGLDADSVKTCYSGNVFTPNVGYNNKVGSASIVADASITDDMIKLVDAPDAPISISNLMFDPPEGAWANAVWGVGVQANVKTTSEVAGDLQVFVAADSNETNPANGTAVPKSANIFMPNAYKLAGGQTGLTGEGVMYLIAQDSADPSGRRVVQEFTILRDKYSPRMDNLSVSKNEDGGYAVSVDVTDSQSGVRYVFASKDAASPAESGRVQLAQTGDNANTWTGSLGALADSGRWYLYAVDKAGNTSASGLVVDDTAAGRIEIWTYDDFKKIGVDPAYPLDGSYIQMADFVIPDGTIHTPIGDYGSPFTGTYDGGGHAITGGKNMKWEAVTVNSTAAGTGLFGRVGGSAAIHNVSLQDFTLQKSYMEEAYVGLLTATMADKATIEQVKIENSVIDLSTDVTRKSANGILAGMFAGQMSMLPSNSVTIKNCTLVSPTVKVANVKDIGLYVGSVTGYTYNGSIVDSVSVYGGVVQVNNVGTHTFTGGFVGDIGNGTAINCYSDAEVTDNSKNNVSVGGFTGFIANGRVENNTSTGSVAASQDIAITRIGGFVAQQHRTSTPIYRNNITTSVLKTPFVFDGATQFVGGFIGQNNLAAANITEGMFFGNTYTGADASGYNATEAALRTSSKSTGVKDADNNAVFNNGITRLADASPQPSTVNITELNLPVTVDSVGDDFGYFGVKWEFEYPDSVKDYFTLSASEGQQVRVIQTKACPAPAEVTLKATYSKTGYSDISKTVKVRGVIAVPDYDTFKKIGVDTRNGYELDRSYYQTQDFTIPANTVHTPIGGNNAPFTGIYDGGNHTVTGGEGMSVVGTQSGGSARNSTFGLFAAIDRGNVRNWSVKDISFEVPELNIVLGAILTGRASSSQFENITIENCTLDACNTLNHIQVGALCAQFDTSLADNIILKNNSITGRADLVTTETNFADLHVGSMLGVIGTGSTVTNAWVYDGLVKAISPNVRYVTMGGFCGNVANKAVVWMSNCHVDGTIVSGENNATKYVMQGGFIGQVSLNSSPSIRDCSTDAIAVPSASDGNGGGFIGSSRLNADQVKNVFTNNTYTANCYYPTRVGTASAVVDGADGLKDENIRLIGGDSVTISNILLDDGSDMWQSVNTWFNGSAKVGVRATAAATASLTGKLLVFISSDPNAESGEAMSISPFGGDGVYTLSASSGTLAGGTQYVIAKNADGSVRAYAPFTILRDVYSPRIADVTVQTAQGDQNVFVTATDSQSGTARVFANESATGVTPQTAGSVDFENVSGGDTWRGALPEGTWYMYAVDRAGNYTDVPVKVEVKPADSDWIPIYSYADFVKIGVEAGYPLDGKYIQMNDFKIPDGTAHTPVGDVAIPFTGIYNGNNCTITGGKNMTWNAANVDSTGKGIGLFGRACGEIYSVKLDKFNITSSDASASYLYAGALSAYMGDGASVHDVDIQDITATFDSTLSAAALTVGGLVGRAAGSATTEIVFSNITAKHVVIDAQVACENYLGGLMGMVMNVNAANCSVESGNVTGKSSASSLVTGGFAAYDWGGTFDHCSADAQIVNLECGDTLNSGGFIGLINYLPPYPSIVRNCIASGSVQAQANAKGLHAASGFIGRIRNSRSTDLAIIQDCVSTVKLSPVGTGAESAYQGSFVADSMNSRISADGSVSATDFSGNLCIQQNGYPKVGHNCDANAEAGITFITQPKPSVSMINVQELGRGYSVNAAAQAFGYSARWSIDNPKFKLSAVQGDSVSVTQIAPLDTANEAATVTIEYSKVGQPTYTEQVTLLGVIDVPDYATFAKVGRGADGYDLDRGYLQTADFAIPANTTWTPIGSANAPFAGTYDGGGHTITGGSNIKWVTVAANAANSKEYASGLFCNVEYGTIRNLSATGFTADVSGSQAVSFGVIAGRTYGATVENCRISDSAIKVASTDFYAYAGGLAGQFHNGTIVSDCLSEHVSVEVIGEGEGFVWAGGLSGFLYGATLTDCHVTDANVTGRAAVSPPSSSGGAAQLGGFVGGTDASNITSCSAMDVTVTSSNGKYNNLGGFIGLSGMWNTGTVITDCKAQGSVAYPMSTGSATIGGFLGSDHHDTAMVMTNNSAQVSITSAAADVSPVWIGGFTGCNHATVEYENNTYTESKYPKVSAHSPVSATNEQVDKGIRLLTDGIEISNIQQAPAYWENMSAPGKTVSATIKANGTSVIDELNVFISDDPLSVANAVPMSRVPGTDTFRTAKDAVKLAGTLFVVARDSNSGGAPTYMEFESRLDPYSPAMESLSVTEHIGTSQDVTVKVRDSHSGVARVYISDDPDAQTAQPVFELALTSDREEDGLLVTYTLSNLGIGTWYLYAVDNVGNKSAEPLRIDIEEIFDRSIGDISQYWDGLGVGGLNTNNRAMVWLGSYNQTGEGESPILWRTLESGSSETLLVTEYIQSGKTFDLAGVPDSEANVFWASKTGVSSNVRAWLNGLTIRDTSYEGSGMIDTAFTQQERALMISTILAGGQNYAGVWGATVNDKLFALSVEQYENTHYFANDAARIAYVSPTARQAMSESMIVGDAGAYWTKTPGDGGGQAMAISVDGVIGRATVNTSDRALGVRPATNLASENIMLVPAGQDGGQPRSMGTLVKTAGAAPNAFNTQYGSDSQTFRVFERVTDGSLTLGTVSGAVREAQAGETLSVDYFGATTGTSNYVSAMLVNKATHEKWQARLQKLTDANGTLLVTLPSGMTSGSYVLFLWAENESNDTASDAVKFTVNVGTTKEENAPAISGGTQVPRAGVVVPTKSITATITDDTAVSNAFISKNPNAQTGISMTHIGGNVWESQTIYTNESYYVIAYDVFGNRSVSNAIPVTDIGIENTGTPPVIENAHQETDEYIAEKHILADVWIETGAAALDRVYLASEPNNITGGVPMTATGNGNEYKTNTPISKAGVYYVVAYDVDGNRSEVSVMADKFAIVGEDDISLWYDGIINDTATDNRAMVWFGGWPQSSASATTNEPLLWRTLKSDVGGITLLTEYAPYTAYFDQNAGNYNQFWYNNTLKTSSDLRAWLNGKTGMLRDGYYGRYITDETTYPSFYGHAFDADEQNMILPVRIDMEAGYRDQYGNGGTPYAVMGRISSLSLADAQSTAYFTSDDSRKVVASPAARGTGNVYGTMTGSGAAQTDGYSGWWLRSADTTSLSRVSSVSAAGALTASAVNTRTLTARPVVTLDSSAVIFTAASADGGAPAALGEDTALAKASGSAPTAFSSTYDAGASFRVFGRGGQSAEFSITAGFGSADTITLNYTDATSAQDNYVAAMLVNTADNMKWVGRIAPITSSSGTVSIKLPVNIGSSGYRLYVWNESETKRNTSEPKMIDIAQLGPIIESVTNVPEEWERDSKTIETVILPRDAQLDLDKLYIAAAPDAQVTDEGVFPLTRKGITGNTYTADITIGGRMYVIAYDQNGMCSTYEFTAMLDKYAPNISGVTVGADPATNVQYVTALVTDSESGVNPSRVFASQDYKDATDGIHFTQTEGTDQFAAFIPAGTWYIYAVDNVGNITDEMGVYKIEVTGTPNPSIGDISQYWDGISNADGTLDAENRAMVWFGDYEQDNNTSNGTESVLWRTLESGTGNVLLMSEYVQNAMVWDSIHSGADVNIYWYNSNNVSSNVRAWLNGVPYRDESYGDSYLSLAFNSNQRAMMLKTVVQSEEVSGAWGGSVAISDELFVLPVSDYEDPQYFTDNMSREGHATLTAMAMTTAGVFPEGCMNYWTTTTVPIYPQRLYLIDSSGEVPYTPELSITANYEKNVYGVRPATNLDTTKIMLTAAGNDGGAPTTMDGSLTQVTGVAPQGYSTTYAADSQSFRVFGLDQNITLGTTTAGKVNAQGGDTLRIDYYGATASENNYFNMLLVNMTSKAKWQGRIAPITTEDGYAEFTLPADLTAGHYAAFIWNENEATQKASDAVSFNIAVGSVPEDTQPPVITGEAQEPADTAQVKKITADITDNVGVTNAFVSMNKNALTGTSMTPVGSGNGWESQNIYYEGTYYVIAYDAAGNRAVSGPVVVSNIANPNVPVITNARQVDNTVANSRRVQADVEWKSGSAQRVFVASDPNATTGIELTLSAGSTYTSTSGVSENGTWYIVAVDSNGNRASAPVYVDKISTVLPTDISTYYDGIVSDTATDNRAMVWFGNYMQSSAGSSEPILWRTVESTTGNILLLSERVLASGNWDNTNQNNTYLSNTGSSNARAWMMSENGRQYSFTGNAETLSGGFWNRGADGTATFSAKEKSMIVNTVLPAEPGLVDTAQLAYDPVFALSQSEVADARLFMPTDRKAPYSTLAATAAGSVLNGTGTLYTENGYAAWLTRTPSLTAGSGYNQLYFAASNDTVAEGSVGYGGQGIRPALNLDPSEVVLSASGNLGAAPAVTTDMTKKTAGTTAASNTVDYGGDNESFRVFERGGNGNFTAQISHLVGETFATVRYSSATYVEDQTYISALLVNKLTKEKYAARIAVTDPSGHGTVRIMFGKDPGDNPDNYVLFVWNENEAARTTSEIVTLDGLKSDREGPEVKTVFPIPDDDSWQKSKQIGATAVDAESGVLKLFYSELAAGATSGTDMTFNSAQVRWESGPLTENKTYYVYGIDKGGNVSRTGVPITLSKIDPYAPHGSIEVGDKQTTGWEWLDTLLETITFGRFSNENREVKITAYDNESDVKSVEYLVSEAAISKDDIESDTLTWTSYSDAFKPVLKPDDRYIVYARVTDLAGNILYIGTDGMVFDATAPELSGDVTVTPQWAAEADTTVRVSIPAAGIEDKLTTGELSGETDIASGIAHVYLMTAADDTAVDENTLELALDGVDYALELVRPDETQTYYLRVQDNAGNWNDKDTSIEVKIQVDFDGPVISQITQRPQGDARILSAKVVDAGSGVREVYLSKDQNAQPGDAGNVVMDEDAAREGYFNASLPAEETTWYIVSYDNVGNRSVTGRIQVGGVDRIPPDIWSVIHNADNTVTANVTDSNSGVGVIYLSKDKDALTGMLMEQTGDGSDYVSPQVSEEGTYYVIAYDRMGNRAVAEVTVGNMDKTKPVVLAAAAEPEMIAEAKNIRVSVDDPAGATPQEKVSGVDPLRVYYTMADDETLETGIALVRQDDGTYLSGDIRMGGTYYVFCYDRAGNRSANMAVDVSGFAGGEAEPVGPSPAEEISGYYQGGGSGSALDSTKALVWLGETDPTLMRTLDANSAEIFLLSEHLIGQTSFGSNTSYTSSALRTQMNNFAAGLGNVPGLKTVNLTDVAVNGAQVYPLNHGTSATSTTGSELNNTAAFPNGNTSRQAGLIDAPTTGAIWWTRTRYRTTTRVWTTLATGGMNSYATSGNYGIRPSLRLTPEDVIFVAAAGDGSAPQESNVLTRTMGAFHSLSASEARISNADAAIGNAQTFRLFTRGGTDASLGTNTQAVAVSQTQVRIDYTGADFGENNFLGAMLVSKTTHEKWTGRIGHISEADGSELITLPSGVMGNDDYLLFVWNENEAGRNTSEPVMFEVGGLMPKEMPAVISITQDPADWTAAGDTKTITAEVTFGAITAEANRQVTIAKNADGTGERYVMSKQGDGSYLTTDVKEGGVWYVIAQDTKTNVSAAAAIAVTIDTTPPDISYAAIGRDNTLAVRAQDMQSGMGKVFWCTNADRSDAQEMTFADGTYSSPILTEPGLYYVYAEDRLHNTTENVEVDASMFYDTAAPDINNISFEDQGDGRTFVRFTAEDIAKGNEPAVGVKTVQWKSGADGTYQDALPDTAYADGKHYYFEIPTPAEGTQEEYYIRAEDWASNVNEVRAMDQKGTISVTAPTKMLFAVYPNMFGQQFFAPEYAVTNNSETVKTKVSVVDFSATQNADGSANEFTIVPQGTTLEKNDNKISLYMQPAEAPGAFAGLSVYNLTPGVLSQTGSLVLGSLEPKTAEGSEAQQGRYTFSGDVPEYDLLLMKDITMRAGFSMTLKFEKDNAVQ